MLKHKINFLSPTIFGGFTFWAKTDTVKYETFLYRFFRENTAIWAKCKSWIQHGEGNPKMVLSDRNRPKHHKKAVIRQFLYTRIAILGYRRHPSADSLKQKFLLDFHVQKKKLIKEASLSLSLTPYFWRAQKSKNSKTIFQSAIMEVGFLKGAGE